MSMFVVCNIQPVKIKFVFPLSEKGLQGLFQADAEEDEHQVLNRMGNTCCFGHTDIFKTLVMSK